MPTLGNTSPHGTAWWFLQISGWLFVAYLIYAQLIPAFNYEFGVQMGTQEPVEQVTDVGVAYWWAFAFADLIVYAPLLIAGLAGHLLHRNWGTVLLAAAFGITVYWPVTSLAAVVAAQGSKGWTLTIETQYWIGLPMIALWGAWGLWQLSHERKASA